MDIQTANVVFHDLQKHLVECNLNCLDCDQCKKVYGERRPKPLEKARLARIAREVLDDRERSLR